MCGKGFIGMRIELAGADITLDGDVELRRVEGLEPRAKSRGASCSTAFSMSSAVVISELWQLRRASMI